VDEKVKGIVISSKDYKDNDKLLTLFTLEKGIVFAKIVGVKKPNAKLKAVKELFCFAEFDLARKGDFLTISLESIANRDISDIHFRFEIFNQVDSIVGTALSDKVFSVNKGQRVKTVIDLPTKNLAPGIYRVCAVAYQCNEFGTQRGIDRVDFAFLFEVYDKCENSIVWLTHRWGNVQLEDIVVREIQFLD
jgi:hypothetical protein